MSLINDALKRAQQAQAQNPPPTPPLEFRAAEANAGSARRSTVMIVAVTLVVVLLLGLTGTLIWYVSQARAEKFRVAARTTEVPMPPAAPEIPSVPPPEVVPSSIPQFERPEEPNTNRVPVSADAGEVVQPTVLKLQGIAFDPQKPSAIVNGRSLYLGDRVEKFRMVAISPVAVTLVSDTETNVLSLSH
jgi:cytoskeletal protein RodZ